jgi:hypothetical protein
MARYAGRYGGGVTRNCDRIPGKKQKAQRRINSFLKDIFSLKKTLTLFTNMLTLFYEENYLLYDGIG